MLVAIAVIVLAGEALSERLKLPAPLLLIVVGAAASFLPMVPDIHLEPEIVLLGLLPPLLYTAAIQTSLVDFTANRKPILVLSVGLVVVTTFAVGAVVNWLIPDLGWPASLAIGAVVAPPDAVAATAVGRRIGLPRRVVTILEGESLLNDATALVALRTAIAAIAGAVTIGEIGLDFLIAAGGGTLAGVIVFLLVARLRRRVTTTVVDTTISLITPYAAYMLAESVHASGVIAVVIAGLLLGHKAPIIQTAPSRIAERTTWGAISFLLENAVFLLIGLQTNWILADVLASDLSTLWIFAVCLAVLVTVIGVRLVWVFAMRAPLLITSNRGAPGWAPYALLVGWAGMRGVVTLAAAFIIPTTVPHREVLLLIALTVVAGTLFLQGLTLPWLTRRLDVETPDPAADALTRAALLEDAGRAGLERLGTLHFDDPNHILDLIRKRVDERSFAAWERLSTAGDKEAPSQQYARIRREMLTAEREKVLQVRATGTVPGDIIAEVLQMLDVEESIIDSRSEQVAAVGSARRQMQTQGCADLAAFPAQADTEASTCPECEAEGLPWVALRRCLACGHVGCCDSSPGRHATRHFRSSQHPVMESAQPGEDWRWCYLHHITG